METESTLYFLEIVSPKKSQRDCTKLSWFNSSQHLNVKPNYDSTRRAIFSPLIHDISLLLLLRWAWYQLCPIWWWQSSCLLEASWLTTWEPTTWCPPPTSESSWTVEVRLADMRGGDWGAKKMKRLGHTNKKRWGLLSDAICVRLRGRDRTFGLVC